MPNVGVRPNVISCNAAIKACAEAGQWQHALSILRGMSKAGLSPDAISYNTAISALGVAGQSEQASVFLLHFIGLVERGGGVLC